MQNLYFHFGHSDCVWVDAEKVMKKSLFSLNTRSEKIQICIGNAKFKKPKKLRRSKFILEEGYFLGNANFSPGRQICVF